MTNPDEKPGTCDRVMWRFGEFRRDVLHPKQEHCENWREQPAQGEPDFCRGCCADIANGGESAEQEQNKADAPTRYEAPPLRNEPLASHPEGGEAPLIVGRELNSGLIDYKAAGEGMSAEQSLSDDNDLEDAVKAIGEVILEGLPANAGFIFYAAKVRAILSKHAALKVREADENSLVDNERLNDEILALRVEIAKLREERDALKHGFVNLYSFIRGKECDPVIGIGMSTSAVDELKRRCERAESALAEARDKALDEAAVEITARWAHPQSQWVVQLIRALKEKHYHSSET